jgi:histidinol-phosphatase
MAQNDTLFPLVRVAIEAAVAGGQAALRHFRHPDLTSSAKADGSPVSEGDRASEAAIVQLLQRSRPKDSILTEESGQYPGDAGHAWFVDPVDGTRSFVRGVASWATLVGLVIDGEPAVGAIYAPAIDQLAVAWTGGGAWLNGRPIGVSVRDRLEDATISIGSLDVLPKVSWGGRAFNLMGKVYACRGFSDAIGHIEVARGHIDAMIDPRGKIWDFAPVAILTREAGGMFSSLTGERGIGEGNALVSNGRLHQALLKELAVQE